MKQRFYVLVVVLFVLVPVLVFKAERVWPECRGVYPHKIILGSSLPLTGHAAYLGREVVAGMRAYFQYINDKGGIAGRHIELKAYDDAYTPPLMIGNIRKLINKDHVFALISLVGTPTTLTVVETCEEEHVPLLFPITGAIELRRPVHRYIFNLRPSYWDECRVAVDYLVQTLGKKRFVVFYQKDAYGLNGLEGVRRRLLHYDLDLLGEASYLRGAYNIKPQVQKLMQLKPDVVALIGTAEVCANFIKESWASGHRKVIFFGVSFTGAQDLAKRLKGLPARVYITQVLPSFEDQKLPAVREYRQIFRRYFPQRSFSALSFEGFLNAKLFIYALKKMGKTPSPEKLIATLESFRSLDLGIGEEISFSPTDHQGLNRVFLSLIKNGQIFYLFSEN